MQRYHTSFTSAINNSAIGGSSARDTSRADPSSLPANFSLNKSDIAETLLFDHTMARETHEDKIKRLSRLVVTLSNEIDYKNHRLLEMEFEKNDASASFLSLTASLTARLDKRDRQLVEMEHTHKLLSEEVTRLSEEKERMLDKWITDGNDFTMEHALKYDPDTIQVARWVCSPMAYRGSRI